MKIRIKGSVGKKELLESISEVLNSLEDAGVNEFKGVNISLNTYVSGQLVVPHANDEEINVQYESKYAHISISNDELGKKKIEYETGVDGCLINLDGRMPQTGKITIPTKQELVDKQEKERELARETRRKEQAELAKRVQQAKKKDQKDKALIDSFFLVIRNKLNMSESEFNKHKLSSGWIRTRYGIERYTLENIGVPIFRVTMQPLYSDEKNVYLFSESSGLVFQGAINS